MLSSRAFTSHKRLALEQFDTNARRPVGLIREQMADAALVPVIALFVLWFRFFLAVNVRIASPKYRPSLEPLFDILTAAECALQKRLPLPRSYPRKTLPNLLADCDYNVWRAHRGCAIEFAPYCE